MLMGKSSFFCKSFTAALHEESEHYFTNLSCEISFYATLFYSTLPLWPLYYNIFVPFIHITKSNYAEKKNHIKRKGSTVKPQ